MCEGGGWGVVGRECAVGKSGWMDGQDPKRELGRIMIVVVVSTGGGGSVP